MIEKLQNDQSLKAEMAAKLYWRGFETCPDDLLDELIQAVVLRIIADDDAPELDDDFFRRAELKKGGVVIRPASGTLTKEGE